MNEDSVLAPTRCWAMLTTVLQDELDEENQALLGDSLDEMPLLHDQGELNPRNLLCNLTGQELISEKMRRAS